MKIDPSLYHMKEYCIPSFHVPLGVCLVQIALDT